VYIFFLFLHIISATVWTGGHLVLTLTVLPKIWKSRDIDELTKFESGFEKIGIPALIIQVITGLWLAYNLLPDIKSWFQHDNPMAHLILLKLFLLLSTLALAAHARFRLIPKLNENNLKSLSYHIITITVIAVLFVIVGVSFRTGGLF
jgi:putative copper export protein